MDVAAWLGQLGLSEHAVSFAENGVDGAMLPELTNEDLKDIGIVRLVDRKRLLRAIAELAPQERSIDAASEEAAHVGEHRQVSVLFADLTGFTRLSNELGAERTHKLLNRYFETVDAIVENYGGRIDKHIGDSVMAVFGAPVAHTNDPERAVRAALDIHAAMVGLTNELGLALSTHIGIASGQVVASDTGSAAHHEYTVTGDTVNLASRLNDAAKPCETLVTPAISDAVVHIVRCAPRGEVTIKGFTAPIAVWAIDGLADTPRADEVGAFIGRDIELRQFAAGLEACRDAGRGHGILVRGEPGIGKSRLVREFSIIAAQHGFSVHSGLVLDFGVGEGRDAVRALVRSLLAVPPGSDEAARRDAANRTVAQGQVDPAGRVFLDDLLDLPHPEDRVAVYRAMDTDTRAKGLRAVVSKLVAARAAVEPCLIVVEDIHWADEVTASYLTSLMDTVANCPGVLIMTSRIEGRALEPGWLAGNRGCPMTTVDLQPLRPAEALQLAGTLAPYGSDLVERCVERSGGNPLFLEQLMRNASDQVDEALPDSLHAVVLARMDRVTPLDREALQAASVLGQRFSLDTLRGLLDDPDFDCAALVKHRLVNWEGAELQFAHALIREGAYVSMLADRRRDLHARAAAWFAEFDPVLHAQHLDRAEGAGAADAYLTAARAQCALFHFELAADLAKRGIEIAKDRETKVQLLMTLGEIQHDDGDNAGGLASYREALELAEGARERCNALIGLASMMRLTDELQGALDLVREAQTVAEAESLDLELSQLHHLRGNLYFPLGRSDDCFREHEVALNYARWSGSIEMEMRALGGLGDAEYSRGRMLTAHGYTSECVRLSREHGFARIEVANLTMLGGGGTNFYMNDLGAGLEAAFAGIERAMQIGHLRAALLAHIGAAQIYYEMEELDRADSHARAVQELAARIGTRRFLARALHRQGCLKLADGATAAAAELFREAIEISRETGIRYCGPLILAALARATSDPAEREAALAEGEALLAEGCVSHNTFEFCEDGMELMIALGDRDRLERYARVLEDFTHSEPLPRSDFMIARARALAGFHAGDRSASLMAELVRLRDEANRVGLKRALGALNSALSVAEGEARTKFG